jgi:N-acetylneuraminic acid mutarotase
MYVLSGYDKGAASASVFKFDTEANKWSTMAPMPAGRCAFASCVVMSNIYVFGGCAHRGDEDLGQDSIFKFDTEADEWSTVAFMPHVLISS